MPTPGKLKVAKAKTEEIESIEYPEDVSQMRFILGVCNVYRRSVPPSGSEMDHVCEDISKTPRMVATPPTRV